ncbi:Murein L,D-transpeptidase YcbB/YkuD [Gemmobacter megaterium]|uniref:Murein L,D-transpeptidase YcbB/YkuD n=1 Tax=Gemmobacter megaterium TaxID=1086013 RepID=A0A1N7NV48_9RHOB|nr:L,D-transpeptidase family protein [Gemmobacter megaterium]GGE16436.1 murein L,D-transpeptidase [Gemmobacter megaterium]SIT02233.1 Murein L,D-transpeptidase YcbB/YkuD [Gemmobacter megaterium]
MQSFFPARLRRHLFVASGVAFVALAGAVAAQPTGGLASGGAALVMKSALPHLNGFRQALAAAAAEDAPVAAFFRDRGYEAFWTATDAEAEVRRAALLAALETAPAHALPVARYDAAALRRAFRDLRSEGDRGRLEVRLTRALLDFARDLQTGVIDPKRVDAGIVRDVPRHAPEDILQGFVTDAAAYLRSLPPQNPEYARLAKARHRMLAQMAAGGWGPQVPAKTLKPGATGAAVVALRDRLVAMGYLARSATMTYGPEIQAAVRALQFDHGLTADGVAGETTMAAINADPQQRLAAVTVAMERERWANIERGKRHIWVNLTDFTAKIIDDGKVTFSTRAVIGSTMTDKRTPEFSHMMTYMEINPDWTVPPGIIRRDYLPKLQANPGALSHLQVVDSRGRVVPRSAINFAAYSARNFPFNLRQPPGASNALGRVKFMFPNPWSIYLHDTPDKHLFARDNRAYSSGCVRLNDPFDFAYALLAPQEADPKTAFHKVLDSGRQERIVLTPPVPVHLDYRTAFTDARGRLQFRADIYGRDALIHAALVRAGVDG